MVKEKDEKLDWLTLLWVVGLLAASGVGFGLAVSLYHLVLRLFHVG